ncbi:hypothetical protein G6L58_19140 [Agrobacterium tumefaciens]|uniref:KAP family P-loop NTPase fold protein n=1 Tax=Agrobacterium tumefaciens TaxID=358 RepID=UPI000EF2504B|nr:hypothetical protein At1D1108_38050 [Agrobacterium tumefaciens]NSY92571.1 hypothetical protein [Agrobacterium tumefaciens]
MASEQEIWKDDRLGRREDADRLYYLTFNRYAETVASNRGGSFVVNVDATWGKGKSFLLSRMYQHVLERKHPAVFINAWENDFIDDPFTLTVSALDEYVKSIVEPLEEDKASPIRKTADNVLRNFGKIATVVLTDLTKTAATKMIGAGVSTVIDLATENNGEARVMASDVGSNVSKSLADISNSAIDDFAKSRLKDVTEAKQSVDSFKEGLEKLLKMIDKATDKKLPFYIFLDELDRCKPTYAIAMLERIKHLFDVTGVVFILATDTRQLGSSIKAVYGNEFDSMHYLQRFFHRSYQLPEANSYLIAYEVLSTRAIPVDRWSLPQTHGKMDVRYFAGFLANTSSQFNLTPRQFEQSIDILHDVTTVWPHNFKIELIMMYPLICLYARDRTLNLESINDFNRTVANSDRWIADDGNNNATKFAPYYSVFRDMMSVSVYAWISQRQRSHNLSMQEGYVFEGSRNELQAMAPNINRDTYRSIINRYTDIILNNRTTFFD